MAVFCVCKGYSRPFIGATEQSLADETLTVGDFRFSLLYRERLTDAKKRIFS
jgi:hypothetical protein